MQTYIGLTVIKNPKLGFGVRCPLCACYSLSPIENSVRYVFHTNYLLIVYVENRKFRIITKNRWEAEINKSTESLDEVKVIVTDEMTKIKRRKINLKLREIEKDFLPYETPDYDAFYPYITDIVK